MIPDTPAPTAGERVQQAAEAFIYGFPLVSSLDEIAAFVAGGGRFPMQAPFNAFGHARDLAGPEFDFVSPNNDTCYSVAMCDVRQGPLVLHVPDTAERYYVLQLIDAWSNNFAYVGRRATGTAEGEFLLTGRDWDGAAPAGMRVVRAPTGIFVIAGRIQVDGDADLPAVRELQDRFTLAPLAVRLGGEPPAPAAGVPQPDPGVPAELGWWERFRVALAAFPPPAGDAPFLQLCDELGLLAPATPFADLDPERAAVLVEGAAAGRAQVEELMKGLPAGPAGWQNAMHLFDYNLDFHEIGAIDAPEWRIGDRTEAYVARAVAARGGLWGNHGYEADYAIAWADADGEPLDGTARYELRFETPPPVDAFWSLTMYDVPAFHLVANPIGRYSIGDRTPGLRYGDDGSVTIRLQADDPGPDERGNWLPAPRAPFRPILRMYQPRPEILDGSYRLPPIRKVA